MLNNSRKFKLILNVEINRVIVRISMRTLMKMKRMKGKIMNKMVKNLMKCRFRSKKQKKLLLLLTQKIKYKLLINLLRKKFNNLSRINPKWNRMASRWLYQKKINKNSINENTCQSTYYIFCMYIKSCKLIYFYYCFLDF